jgi:transporter family-2 protein
MEGTLLLALLAALGSGVAIGVQSNLTNLSGQTVGPVRTGLLLNLFGGLIALVILVGMTLTGSFAPREVPGRAILFTAGAGALGILIITGVAYALPRTGLAVGFAVIVAGQMVVGLIVDGFGLGGAAPIGLDPRRLLGVAVMVLAVFLLLPRH